MAAAQTTGSLEAFKRQDRIAAVPAPEHPQDTDYAELQRVQAFMVEARERFRDAANASDKQRREMLEDLKFYCGLQWDQAIQAVREQQGRPCLTLNRIPGFVSHVVNNMRQARPQIKIDPIADGADEEIAQIRQGLIRHIELDSRSEIAYDTGFKNMAITGLGYMRVLDSREPKSFDMDLKIEWVSNTFTVYEDPAAAKPDWSDGRYKFVVEDISLAEFKRRFPEKAPASLSEFKSIGDSQPYWLLGDKIRIAEYFHIEEEEDILCEMPDGSTEYVSEILGEDAIDQETGARVDVGTLKQYAMRWLNSREVTQTRPENRPYVMWTLMYGLGILKERRWLGKYIPIIPVIGDQTDMDGERILVGMVRHAREAQRMFNYMYSCFVEACALAPKAPFVAEFSQIEEFYDLWKTANTNPQAALPYRSKSTDGQLEPPPHRETAEPPIQAFVEGLKLSDNNLKSVFRIFDASLGQKGPQESGVAINSRKVESDLATYDWADNFTRALRYLGMVLDDLLPHYYNRPGRIVQILQEDLQQKKPTVMNQLHDVEGEQKIYDLSKGKFATTVATGPSVATRRQEFASSALDLAKVYPQIMQVAGPQIVRAMDWPDKDIIAAQLEKAMPPELRTEDAKDKQDDPAQLKQTLAQAMQQIQQLSQLLTEASDKKDLERMKEEFATLRTTITADAAIAVADLKAGVEQSQVLSNEIFEEFKRLRAVLEPPMPQNPNGPASPNSPSPESAAPGAPMGQSPPPSGGSTAAEVGIGA